MNSYTLYILQVDTFGNTDPDQYGNRKIAIGALHVLKQVFLSSSPYDILRVLPLQKMWMGWIMQTNLVAVVSTACEWVEQKLMSVHAISRSLLLLSRNV